MFRNIKLNKNYWHKLLPFLKFGIPDPLLVFSNDEAKFSEAMTSFRFARVFKTTRANRHSQTQQFLKQYAHADQSVIIDLGASDGSTSLNFIELLTGSFKKYFVTDYNIKCNYIDDRRYTYFFNHLNECFLIASKRFVFYPDSTWLINLLFKKQIKRLKNKNKTELLLCNHRLLQKQKTDKRIIIMSYNIFEPWKQEKADIMIVGNLLNRSYFSQEEIEKALSNCYNTLSDNGCIAIIRNELADNNEIEHANVYIKKINTNSFENIYEVNGGVEINNFILSLQFS
jgi:hypothetical protein